MSNDNFCICSWGVETIGLHERGHWDQGLLRHEPNSLILQIRKRYFANLTKLISDGWKANSIFSHENDYH